MLMERRKGEMMNLSFRRDSSLLNRLSAYYSLYSSSAWCNHDVCVFVEAQCK